MGNKTSMYQEVYPLRGKVKTKSTAKAIGGYLNYAVFPIGGIIGISSTCIENFNGVSGSLVSKFIPPVDITCADFNPSPRTLAIGLNDGKVFLIDPDTLTQIRTLHYDPKQEQEVIATAVNCHLAGRVIVGYSNGIAKEFKINEEVAFNVFLTLDIAQSPSSERRDMNSPIDHIEVAGELIFILQRSTERSSIKVYKSDSSAAQVSIGCEFRVVLMRVMERYRAIMVFSQDNEVSMYSYVDGEFAVKLSLNIQGIDGSNKLSYGRLLPCTEQIKKIYKSNINDNGDLLYIGYESGHILAGRFAMSMSGENKIQCTFAPYNVYKASDKIDKNIIPSIIHLYIDPVTDHLLATVNESICLIERAVIRLLDPDKAKVLDEEDKVKNSSFLYRIGVWKSSRSVEEVKEEISSGRVEEEQDKMEEKKNEVEEIKDNENEENLKKIQEERLIMERLAKAAQDIQEVGNSPKVQEQKKEELIEEINKEPQVNEIILQKESIDEQDPELNIDIA